MSKPDRVRNPVDKNGEGFHDPSFHLVCYKIKDVKGQPKFAGTSVFTGNQFGPGQTGPEQLKASKAGWLCVPSTKTDLGAIP